MPEYLTPSEDASTEITEVTQSSLAVLAQSEHAAMVTTANLPNNRRKLDDFDKKLMQYATHSQGVALSMFYTLPRAGRQIIGASVRFAEIVAPCWKNCSTGSRVIGSTDDTVTAQGVFIDYESNVRNVKEVPRRITDKDGRKFNADMILTTSKAALSIAYRDAILKGGVPAALWDPAYEQAKLTAVGKAMSHAQRVDAAMEYLMKLGVTETQIMNAIGCASPKELEVEHLVTLRTLCEEIKKGDRTIEDVFGTPHDKEITALFIQLKMPVAQQELLKASYRGKQIELLENLRARLAPTQKTEAVVEEAVKEDKKRTKKDKTEKEPQPENHSVVEAIQETTAEPSGKFDF